MHGLNMVQVLCPSPCNAAPCMHSWIVYGPPVCIVLEVTTPTHPHPPPPTGTMAPPSASRRGPARGTAHRSCGCMAPIIRYPVAHFARQPLRSWLTNILHTVQRHTHITIVNYSWRPCPLLPLRPLLPAIKGLIHVWQLGFACLAIDHRGWDYEYVCALDQWSRR